MKKLAVIVLIALGIGMAVPLSHASKASAAVGPGCYEVIPVPSVGAAVGKVGCDVYLVWFPDWRIASFNDCWSLSLNAAGMPENGSKPELKDCASITVNAAPNLDGTIDTAGAAQQRQDAATATDRNNAGLDGSGCQLTSGGTGSKCQSSGYLTTIINVLSASVGIIVVIMIIVGGIQYSSSNGDPGRVAAAKQRIINAVLALIAFLFLFAFLQWLVPGGIL